MRKKKYYGQYIDINGAKVWQNPSGTLEEITIIPNPKVKEWYRKGLKSN